MKLHASLVFCACLVCKIGLRDSQAQLVEPVLRDTAAMATTIGPKIHPVVQDASTANNVFGTDERVSNCPTGTSPATTKMEVVPAQPNGPESPQGPRCGRYAKDGCQRAGCPTFLSRFAMFSVSDRYSVGYVGGGSPLTLFGQPRTIEEGTFSFDSSGWLLPKITWLKWNHGSRYQGGHGAYSSDGPRLLPE